MKRHTCVICKKKRYEYKMDNVFESSWACLSPFGDCSFHPDIRLAKGIVADMKKLQVLGSFFSSPAVVCSGRTK